MEILNLTQVGGLVLVEYTGRSDRLISANNPSLDIDMPRDGTSNVGVTLAGRSYPLSDITKFKVAGEAATDQSDLLTKIATVFPEANGGSGGSTPNLDQVLAAGATLTENRDIEMNGNTIGMDSGTLVVEAIVFGTLSAGENAGISGIFTAGSDTITVNNGIITGIQGGA